MTERLARIIDLTSSLTEEKLVEMIRELRFGKNLEKLYCPPMKFTINIFIEYYF